MNGTLARQQTVRDIVAAYQSTCAVVRRTFAEVIAAERALNIALTADGDPAAHDTRKVHISADRHGWSNFEEVERVITHVRQQTWHALAVRLELQLFTSPQRWREIEKSLEADGLPEITVESVADFVQSLMDQRVDLLTETVQATFNFLRAHRPDYKTNDLVEVGPKVVLTWMVELGWGTKSGLRLRYDRDTNLLAMERVFSMLDGRGEISKAHWSDLRNAIAESREGETTWCRYRAFKNGNLHLAFRRLDLVKRLNEVAGGKRLRPEKRRPVAAADAMEVAS